MLPAGHVPQREVYQPMRLADNFADVDHGIFQLIFISRSHLHMLNALRGIYGSTRQEDTCQPLKGCKRDFSMGISIANGRQ